MYVLLIGTRLRRQRIICLPLNDSVVKEEGIFRCLSKSSCSKTAHVGVSENSTTIGLDPWMLAFWIPPDISFEPANSQTFCWGIYSTQENRGPTTGGFSVWLPCNATPERLPSRRTRPFADPRVRCFRFLNASARHDMRTANVGAWPRRIVSAPDLGMGQMKPPGIGPQM